MRNVQRLTLNNSLRKFRNKAGLRFLLLSLVVGTLFSSCQEKRPTPQEEAAPALFADVMKTLRSYSDSLRVAKDSASVERLTENLTEVLTKVNFRVPANTDLALSEDENDTIYKLTGKLMKIRAERLEKLSKDSLVTEKVDSLNSENLKSSER